ncbi:MAG: DUF933 domain-containing protein, partial [Myxococcota bacterium]
MKAALIGLPFCGKTTVYEALTGMPVGRKEESLATIKVPDERIEYLAGVFNPGKKVYAEFVLHDFNPEGNKADELSAKVKNMIQKMDMLILVIRDFDSMLTDRPRNALSEYTRLRDELIFSDLVIVEKRLEREEKEHKNPPDLAVLKRLHAAFEANSLPDAVEITPQEREMISNYSFLTLKKRIVLVNKAEDETGVPQELEELLRREGVLNFAMSAMLEKEINEIPPEDRASFLQGYGLSGTARDRLIGTAYSSMNLISFLTVGPDEVRAWPIRKGSSAVEAAGKIHTDIARGFIRAEVVAYETFKT